MILATVSIESPKIGYFEFAALGDNEDHCENLLTVAWNRHCDETGDDRERMVQLVADHRVTFADIAGGVVLRDGDRIYPAKAKAKGSLDAVVEALKAAGVAFEDQRAGGYPDIKVLAPETGHADAYFTVYHDDNIETEGREYAVFYHFDGRRGACSQVEADNAQGDPLLTVAEVVGTVSNAPLG